MFRKVRDLGVIAILAIIVIIVDYVFGFGPGTFLWTAMAVLWLWHLTFEVLEGRSIY